MITQRGNQSDLYCAFLRGVNVNGTTMRMEQVCAVFEKSGMNDVASVLASGNIIFSSGKTRDGLKPLLEKAMSAYFKYDAFLFVKNKNEIEKYLLNNPFKPHPQFHVYGFAGIDGIENILMQEFKKSQKTESEEARIAGGNFYWRISKGNTLHSDFGKILGNKKLKNTFTSRNMNTFEKVLKKM